MKKYWSFFRIRFSTGLQYRAAALAGIATQFFWGIIELLMFAAFYRWSPQNFPMTFSQLANYIWLQQAFLALFVLWRMDNDIFSAITQGNIAYELVRPAGLYAMWFVKNAAMRCSSALLRCIPVLVVAVFLPAPYGLTPPPSLQAGVLFILALMLALATTVCLVMLVYVLTFYTMSPMGIRMVAVSLGEFLSGSVIPLPFLPDWLRGVVELLPFAATANTPLRVYSGQLAGAAAWQAVGLQLFWIGALVLLGNLLLRRALHRVVVQGG